MRSHPAHAAGNRQIVQYDAVSSKPVNRKRTVRCKIFQKLRIVELSSALVRFFIEVMPVFDNAVLKLNDRFGSIHPGRRAHGISAKRLHLFKNHRL